jgi:SAM-dependent methyltransferase
MRYRVSGRAVLSREQLPPLCIEASTEEDAREQALARGMIVEEIAPESAEDDSVHDLEREDGSIVCSCFVPTPMEVVDKMLEAAKVTKDDVLYDLGCGDGRIVCTAARRYGCKAVGFDIDPALVKASEAAGARESEEVRKLISFEVKDIYTLDLSPATVLMVFLLPHLNARLIPQLEKLKPNARIVSHSWDMKGIPPDEGYPIVVNKRLVYLWTTPLKSEEALTPSAPSGQA